MTPKTTRRSFLAGAAGATAAVSFPALAESKPKLRFSAVFSEQDIRAEMMKKFAESIAGDFTFEGYYGGNLFKQGTELVALQRGNLEMGNIAPQDYLEAASGLVDPDRRLSVPGRRPHEGVLRQRSRRGNEEDDRGQARRAHPGADLFRRPPGRPEAGQEDHDAGRHGRHQAAHAARRGVAVPGQGARRQSDRRWPTPRSTPACRPARSTDRTTRCRTSRT